jgi:endonuclease/exonuclease/phosphatase family metal-dependent hydrolase
VPLFLLPFSLFLFTLFSSACVRVTPPALAPVSGGACRSATVQWFAPADAGERKRLDSWCAGVGSVAIQPLGDTTPARTIGLEAITFVSWNVHVGSGDIRAFVRDLRAGHHTDGRKVDEFVLMLQEAVRTDGVPAFAGGASGADRIAAHGTAASIDIVQIARELGLSLIYVPSMRNGKSADDPQEDRGNAILSTLPLMDPVAVELPGERQRRVVIVARAAPVSVGTVHLDALGGGKRLWLFWTPWMRDVQIRSVASQLPDGPLVLGGDLNTWHGRHELVVRFLNGVARETSVTASRQGLGLRVLDYLFFRVGPNRRARYRHLANRYGSDHGPLVGWIERP